MRQKFQANAPAAATRPSMAPRLLALGQSIAMSSNSKRRHILVRRSTECHHHAKQPNKWQAECAPCFLLEDHLNTDAYHILMVIRPSQVADACPSLL